MVSDPCPMHKRFHTIPGLPGTLFCPAYTMAGTNHHGCSMSSLSDLYLIQHEFTLTLVGNALEKLQRKLPLRGTGTAVQQCVVRHHVRDASSANHILQGLNTSHTQRKL